MSLSGWRPGRWCVRVALFALLLLMAPTVPTTAAASLSEWCEGETLRDYTAPLKRMPRLQTLPDDGEIDSAHSNVRLETTGEPLAVGGGTIGYQFSLHAYKRPAHPRWDVTAMLWQVDWQGRNIQPVDRIQRRLNKIGLDVNRNFSFEVPAEPALYRVTIVLRSASGRRLLGFGGYYRVVKPAVHAALSVNGPAYGPGQTVFARVENYGTAYALYSSGYTLEKLEGESWVLAPESPRQSTRELYFIPPGMSGDHCLQFTVPQEMVAGTYRMSSEARFAWPGSTTRVLTKQPRGRKLRSVFAVVPNPVPPWNSPGS